MLFSSIKATLRHLWRNRLFTALNILGLTIGISACWVVYRIVDYELSYDKQHPDAERVFQLVGRFENEKGESGFGGIPQGLAPVLTQDITGLELVVPVYTSYAEKLTVPAAGQHPARDFENPRIAATLPAYFDLVPHQWLAGSKQGALDAPDKVVLTKTRAREYFPDTEPEAVIGQTLFYNDTLARTITGVVANLPYPSSFGEQEFIAVSPEAMASDNWISWNSNQLLFVKMEAGKSVAPLLAFANQKKEEYVGDREREWAYRSWFEALPLPEKHFANEYATARSASMNVLYGLMGIAFFLLVLACINYVNLSTAQMPRRSREIGIRKTLGGTPRALIGNFLVETMAITLVAILLAIPITKLWLGVFPEFMPEGMMDFQNHGGLALFLLALLAAITFVAGLYPAWLITKVQTVRVLKGETEKMVAGARLNLRKALIVFQFAIAQVFVVGALVIGQQLDFTLGKDLGFTHDAMVNIRMPHKKDQGGDIDPFLYKQGLGKYPEITGVALGHLPLSNNHWGTTFHYQSDTGNMRVNMPRKYIDPDYLDLYELHLLAGRTLSQTDTLREIILNEAAAKAFGFQTPAEAVGQILTMPEGKVYPIVGVVADFHQKTLHVEIEPIALGTSTRRSDLITFNIKLPDDRSQWKETFAIMETEWKRVYPNAPFEYRFNDEHIKSLYESEHRTSKLIGLATGITIFISCLGLFGLATLTAFQRTKEIGIRKVLGASVSGIVAMLSKDFVKLVCVAIVIASPIAWWAMNKWLEDFAYRIDIQWWVFALAGLVAVVIALLTVSWQAVRAAVTNPVESLRDE